jgi:hypothetical protein
MQSSLTTSSSIVTTALMLLCVLAAVPLGINIVNPPHDWNAVLYTGAALFALSFMNWRVGVFTALFLLVIEGAIRKWVFPEWHQVIYLAKDLVLAGAYLRFFGGKIIRHERLFMPHPINRFIALLFFWGLAEALNPSLPNLLVGAFGLKAYFFYIPLFYMVPEVFLTKKALTRFLIFYVLCSIPLSVLGIVQFFSPPDSLLVTYLGWGEESKVSAISLVGNFPRVSGTFSYISGYVTYLFVLVLILFALLRMKENISSLKKAVLLSALVLALANLFMTGSRWPIFMLVLLIPVIFWMGGRLSSGGALRLLPRVAFGMIIVTFALSFFFRDAVTAFWQRTSSNSDVEGRIIDTVTTPFVFAGYAYAWGSGIGSTHQATAFLVKDRPPYSWLPTDDFEEEPERIMLELGVIGFLLFYGLKSAFLLAAWRLTRQLKDLDLKLIAMVVFLVQLSFFVSPTVFNVTASFYYWFLSGLLILLPKLDRPKSGVVLERA